MRDLNEAEIYQLETMMDKTSLQSVLAGVAHILEGKSAHLARPASAPSPNNLWAVNGYAKGNAPAK